MSTPGLPYRWFWAIGIVFVVITAATLVGPIDSRWGWPIFAFAGVAFLVLGFVQRHRGSAPALEPHPNGLPRPH